MVGLMPSSVYGSQTVQGIAVADCRGGSRLRCYQTSTLLCLQCSSAFGRRHQTLHVHTRRAHCLWVSDAVALAVDVDSLRALRQ